MAASLLLLLLVSACTAELGFQPKRQYTYLYEAKQASGIPGLKSQWSAIGMKMKVKIQAPTSDNLYFQLKDVQQGELTNEFTNRPWRQGFDIQYSPVSRYQEQLSKVFKVKLSGGVITKITVTEGEAIPVVNIKKSIAQLFQLDMQKHQAIEIPSMAQPSGYQSGQQADSFKVMEDSIGGECETLYETTPRLPDDIKAHMLQELTILSQSSKPDIEVPHFDQFHPFIVTKTKNYQNCKSRPIWQHMMPGAVSCRSDDCYLTASNRSSSSRYVLDGDRGSFKIQYMLAESETLLFPYGHETEQLWTFTNQTLFLNQSGPMGSFVGEPQQSKSYETVAFQYPTVDGRKLEMPDLYKAPQMNVHEPGVPVKLILEQVSPDQLVVIAHSIIEQVDQTLQYVPDPVHQDVAGYVLELERALSWLSYSQLEQVYKKLTTQGQNSIFWDTVVMAGTNPAVMIIVDGIKTGKIEKARVSQILATLPIYIKTPTFPLLDKLFQLYRSDVIQTQRSPRMTMALSLGNILYQVCVSNTTVDHGYTHDLYPQRFCTDQTILLLREKFIPFMKNKVEQTQGPEKLAYIQALGNTADQRIVSILFTLISQEKSPMVATKAIYSFYRVITQYPEQVRRITSSIFHDVTQPTRVRITALSVLLTSNPPMEYWQRIATLTWIEQNHAMNSFIHSTLSTLANITMAQDKRLFEMSRRARITLPLAREPRGGFTLNGGFNYINGELIPEYQVAAITHVSVIASNTSLIPSDICVDFKQYINSIVKSNYHSCLQVQGGQKIIDALMGVDSQFSFRRQSARDLRTQYHQLESLLKSQEPEKFEAQLYTAMGTVENILLMDEDSLREVVDKVRQGGSMSSQSAQKIAYLKDTTFTMPSEIGMPIISSQKMPVVASARGQMEVKWSLDDGQVQVSMENVQPFVVIKSLVTVGTVNPFSLHTLGAGVDNKAQLSLPMSLKAKFDLQAKKLQVEMETVQQPSQVKVAHIQTIPFTTAVKVTSFENIVKSSDTKEITLSSKTNITVPFGKALGVEGLLRLDSNNPIMNFGTFWTELQKRGMTGVTNFWLMMGSLRSRHYDIVIDTSKSTFKKVQVTLASGHPDIQDIEMRQPVISNQQHTYQVRSSIQSVRRSLQAPQLQIAETPQQRKLAMDSKAGYVGIATITEKNGRQLHYNSSLALASDALWYKQKLSFRAESPSNQVCLDSEMAFPVLSDIREQLLNTDVKAPVWAKLGYGSSCQQHTLEMQGDVRRDEVAREYARTCPAAQRCIQHESRGNPNSADCRLAKSYAAFASSYQLEFTGYGLTPNFQKAAYGLEKYIQYRLWPYMHTDPFAHNPDNKVSIKVRMDPYTNGVSLNVSKPHEDIKFLGVPQPVDMLYEPGLLTMRKSFHKKFVDSLYGVDKSVCIIDRQVIKTFDNVTLERRPSDCWTLMTTDGSRIRNLSIYEKVIRQQSVVQAQVDDTQIEIDNGNLYQVKANNQIKRLDVGQPIVIRDATNQVIAEVRMLTPDTVKILLPKHYAKLLITKEGLQIRASMMAYRNRMRGVCGDFNGEQRNDLVAGTGCVYTDGQKFYKSYQEHPENPAQCKPQPPKPEECVAPSAKDLNVSQGYYQNVPRY